MQKGKTIVKYQHAFDEMSYEDLLDPKAAEKAKQQQEAALKLQKVTNSAALSSPFLSIL